MYYNGKLIPIKEKNAIISICCEIFQLYENLYLVHFNKTDGPLKSYLRVYQKIFEKLPINLFEIN